MDPKVIYWNLDWFDPTTEALVGSARLDTLTDDEVYDAFHQSRDDPYAFEGEFVVEAAHVEMLQRHTDHQLDPKRYLYYLGEVDATPSTSDRTSRDDALSMTTVFQGKEHRLSWYLSWHDPESDDPGGGERLYTLTTDDAFEIFHQDREDPHAFRGGCAVAAEQVARLQAYVEHRIDVGRYKYHLNLAFDPWLGEEDVEDAGSDAPADP